jgi:hypothetical protein
VHASQIARKKKKHILLTGETKFNPRKAGDGYDMDHGNPLLGEIKGSLKRVLA